LPVTSKVTGNEVDASITLIKVTSKQFRVGLIWGKKSVYRFWHF